MSSNGTQCTIAWLRASPSRIAVSKKKALRPYRQPMSSALVQTAECTCCLVRHFGIKSEAVLFEQTKAQGHIFPTMHPEFMLAAASRMSQFLQWSSRHYSQPKEPMPSIARWLTSALHSWMMHFLKFRISVQTCSSVRLLLATCSIGTMQQCKGSSRAL